VNPHHSIGELLDPTEPVAFVALIELMDSLGCRFVVNSSDDVGYDGPLIPAWCGHVASTWFDLILTAHTATTTGHHLHACQECCWPMLLTADRKHRRCPICNQGTMTRRLPIRFTRLRHDDGPTGATGPKEEWTGGHATRTDDT
jgi:hypothetical protein